MKFGFVTCVQLGLSCIEEIYRSGGKLELIITLNDANSKLKSGRVFLDDISNKFEIPLYKVDNINEPYALEIIERYDLDWLYIIGWSQIAHKTILDKPKFGVIGAHPTLLPEGRGRAAIPWAIIKGIDITGVTFFKMDEAVDSGPIIKQTVIKIQSDEDSSSLYEKINSAHIKLIREVHHSLLNENYTMQIQDESKATYWIERKPKDGQLFREMTVKEVDKLVRATTKPYPGAFLIDNQNKIIIWKGIVGSISGVLHLEFSDGIYSAFDYEITKNS